MSAVERPVSQELNAQAAINDVLKGSAFDRAEPTNPDTTIDNGEHRYKLNRIPDGQAEIIPEIQKFFENKFGKDEVDPEEVFRNAIDGNTAWGTKDVATYQVHTIQNEAEKVLHTLAGGRLQLTDSNGRSLDTQMFMIAYAMTDASVQGQGLPQESYASAIMQAAKDAAAEGKQLSLSGIEAVHTSEDLLNKIGFKRVYIESTDKPGSYEELRYVQPALDFDPATGAVAEDAGTAAEHLMVHGFGKQEPTKEDILATVRAFYTWNNTWPQEAFENVAALEAHRQHVQAVWSEFKDQIEKGGRLVYLDKDGRERMRRDGSNIFEHTAANKAGNTGPEDF